MISTFLNSSGKNLRKTVSDTSIETSSFITLFDWEMNVSESLTSLISQKRPVVVTTEDVNGIMETSVFTGALNEIWLDTETRVSERIYQTRGNAIVLNATRRESV